MSVREWCDQVIKQEEIDKFLTDGKDFIDEAKIWKQIEEAANPSAEDIRAIIKKALSIQTLSPQETAKLINLKDEALWREVYQAAGEIKRKVYDNRVVFFAPLYAANLCVNNCAYCSFRTDNSAEVRKILSMDQVKQETAAVVDEGHKRLILVFGEHPQSDVNYMERVVKAVYSVRRKTPKGSGYNNIRRVNINAAPMSTADLKKIKAAGIGTYQVFQETYHKESYAKMHPAGTLKGNYRWRLYAMHRAMDAGIDDMAIGALFGLYDWRFEVMGLLYHALDLEKQTGIGPHTISFPRLQEALGAQASKASKYLVSDADFKKIVAILRLSVPYTGMIITARETEEMRKQMMEIGCTQTDASTKIGVGAYSAGQLQDDNPEKVQFKLKDESSLDHMVGEFARLGHISSFCTAGYRCGRTGDKIMGLLRNCTEGKFCKLNAVLTFREFLNDYASPETVAIGEKVIEKELKQIKEIPFFQEHNLLEVFFKDYEKTLQGQRDLYL